MWTLCWWLCAKLQFFHCWYARDTAVLHKAIITNVSAAIFKKCWKLLEFLSNLCYSVGSIIAWSGYSSVLCCQIWHMITLTRLIELYVNIYNYGSQVRTIILTHYPRLGIYEHLWYAYISVNFVMVDLGNGFAGLSNCFAPWSPFTNMI